MSQSIIVQEDTGMSGFTIGDLGVFIGTIGGVVTSILIVLQKSKCKKIGCCGIGCEREIPPDQPPNEQQQADQEQGDEQVNLQVGDQEQIPPQNP